MLKSIERSLEKVPMKSLHSDEGQVAVILVLITAMALIFYAVILNLGSMTQTKTIITLAANQAVAMLASEMASYGNSLTQTHLRGRKKVCDSTNVLVLIIGLIITIIITVFFPPAGLALALVIFGILLTVGAIYIQLVYVQPMMTELWNKASQETMSTRDSFLEQAINTGLRTAITDSVQVPDVFDYDADGLWGFDGLTHKDEMSRYSFYYHNRYESVEQLDDDFLDEDFLPALQEFVYNESDGWGLYDPIDDTLCVPSSAADHAC